MRSNVRQPVCAVIRAGLVKFFGVLQNVPSDNHLGDEASELAWKLDRKGWVIPGPDVVIACSALRIGAVLLTNDKFFEKIPGLRVRHWP